MFMMLHNVEVGLLSALIIVIVPHIRICYLCRKRDLGTIIMVILLVCLLSAPTELSPTHVYYDINEMK